MSQVQKTLEAWREAERRLETASDPLEISALRAEAERFHEAYRRAVDTSGADHGGVMSGRVPTNHGREPNS